MVEEAPTRRLNHQARRKGTSGISEDEWPVAQARVMARAELQEKVNLVVGQQPICVELNPNFHWPCRDRHLCFREAPIDGEIIEVNNQIENNPDYLNSDPYKNGWLIKIKVNLISSVDELLDFKAYSKLIS